MSGISVHLGYFGVQKAKDGFKEVITLIGRSFSNIEVRLQISGIHLRFRTTKQSPPPLSLGVWNRDCVCFANCEAAGKVQISTLTTSSDTIVTSIRFSFLHLLHREIAPNMRGRSCSYSPSPSPPRRYSRRRHSLSPRGRYRGCDRDLPTSLLVRNLNRDCRPEDLHGPFGQFGPLKDVYLPRDYYTGEPRGFGFVQYVDPADAADAKYHMDGRILLGREITVVFAEENRKKPAEMRAREHRRDRSHDYRRSSRTYSPSPDYSPSPRRRRHYRSISPRDRKYRDRSYSRSSYASRSRSRSRSYSRSLSRSPGYSR
ncbi:Serine/arginine-rich SC35-like splicing factor SCL30A isoform B [Glycine soja]|uniref:Serine/arginine-rich SC35-like splicing factor SCL30A isoform B n=1 Tax=Glycine soja TaxID=3848 RepID=A0A445IZF8_GLYSO|nr:Serine/arginine-rich SC35-like splicing factor SCL30A isoform B [Glycine soja]